MHAFKCTYSVFTGIFNLASSNKTAYFHVKSHMCSVDVLRLFHYHSLSRFRSLSHALSTLLLIFPVQFRNENCDGFNLEIKPSGSSMILFEKKKERELLCAHQFAPNCNDQLNWPKQKFVAIANQQKWVFIDSNVEQSPFFKLFFFSTNINRYVIHSVPFIITFYSPILMETKKKKKWKSVFQIYEWPLTHKKWDRAQDTAKESHKNIVE